MVFAKVFWFESYNYDTFALLDITKVGWFQREVKTCWAGPREFCFSEILCGGDERLECYDPPKEIHCAAVCTDYEFIFTLQEVILPFFKSYKDICNNFAHHPLEVEINITSGDRIKIGANRQERETEEKDKKYSPEQRNFKLVKILRKSSLVSQPCRIPSRSFKDAA